MRSEEGKGEKIMLFNLIEREKSWAKHLETNLTWAIFGGIREDYAISRMPITIKIKESAKISHFKEALSELVRFLDLQDPSQNVFDFGSILEAETGKEV